MKPTKRFRRAFSTAALSPGGAFDAKACDMNPGPLVNADGKPNMMAVMPLLTGKKEEFKADMGGKISPIIMLLAMSDKCTSAIMDPTVQKLLTGGP